MKKISFGFSLIELMCVIAILGVLVAVAVPAYSRYRTNAKYSEILEILNYYKTNAGEYYNTNGTFVTFNDPGQIPTSAYITTLFHNGTATAVQIGAQLQSMGSGIDGNYLYLILTSSSNGILTACCGAKVGSGLNIPQRLMPTTCNSSCTPP